MKYNLSFIIILIIILFSACEEDNSSLLTTETAVVQAYLYAGQKLDSIKITQSNSYSSNNSSTITLDNLDVNISNGTNNFQLESIGDGFYQNLAVEVQSEQSYSLKFEYNGETITAETYVPSKKEAIASVTEVAVEKIVFGSGPPVMTEQPDPIELQWDNTEGDYYYVVVQNIAANPEYINEGFEGMGSPFRFISEPQVMDLYAIDTRREIQQFGMHRIIVFRVNPEYAALYETSGSTSTTIVEPPSNLENALGLFTGVSSDTLFLNVIEQ